MRMADMAAAEMHVAAADMKVAAAEMKMTATVPATMAATAVAAATASRQRHPARCQYGSDDESNESR